MMMMAPRFYCPDPIPETGEFCLPEALVHHAVRVLRLRAGETVELFDGRGGALAATLVTRGKQWFAQMDARLHDERESPLAASLVQALASGDKMDWIVQKAVELGVASIVPVRASRSVLRLNEERATKRLAHWQQVVVAACEQSGRNRVPTVEPLSDLDVYLNASRGRAARFVLDPVGGARLASFDRPTDAVHVLVGPEGGWSDAELATCRASGCAMITLGPRVLRTETAGLATLAAIQTLWGDF